MNVSISISLADLLILDRTTFFRLLLTSFSNDVDKEEECF